MVGQKIEKLAQMICSQEVLFRRYVLSIITEIALKLAYSQMVDLL